MEQRYCIQILDETSYRIMYFDRMKTSYGGHRIITSLECGKIYTSKERAEADSLMILQYYGETCLVEVVEC